jgi:hypothetical protein
MFLVCIGSPSPIEVLVRIIMLPFLFTCVSTWGLVPEVFELIFEEVLGPFLTLIIARVVLVVVLGSLVALVEVPGRLLSLSFLLMLRPLVSVVLVFLLSAASGRATPSRCLLPLRVWVVIYFSELVIEGALSFIFEDLVGGADLLEFFLVCLVPLGFVRVVFLSQLVISLFDVSSLRSRGHTEDLVEILFAIIPQPKRPPGELPLPAVRGGGTGTALTPSIEREYLTRLQL